VLECLFAATAILLLTLTSQFIVASFCLWLYRHIHSRFLPLWEEAVSLFFGCGTLGPWGYRVPLVIIRWPKTRPTASSPSVLRYAMFGKVSPAAHAYIGLDSQLGSSLPPFHLA
jgi:hypothetical protein